MTHKQRVYVFSNSISRADLLYEGDLVSEYIQDQFKIVVDRAYSDATPPIKISDTAITTDIQLKLKSVEKISHKKFTFEEFYRDGT